MPGGGGQTLAIRQSQGLHIASAPDLPPNSAERHEKLDGGGRASSQASPANDTERGDSNPETSERPNGSRDCMLKGNHCSRTELVMVSRCRGKATCHPLLTIARPRADLNWEVGGSGLPILLHPG